MSKSVKKTKASTTKCPVHFTTPWSCTNFGSESEIEAYVEVTGSWETIANVHSVGDLDAEDIADFIIQSVNAYVKTHIEKT
jgi:hypothetical protein